MLRAAILFSLAVFISQSDAHCFRVMATDCVYNGHIIADKATDLIDDCLSCRCKDEVIGCCSIGATITGYPPQCTVIPDGPCNQKAVMINNHAEPCDGITSAIGR